MLGRDVLAELAASAGAGPEAVTALDRADLDLTDPAAVRSAVAGHDLVVNAAAWTDVDRAEAEEAAATAVNGTGVRNLAAACAVHGARLIHVSTDYVFAGDAGEPYPEDAPTAPLNAYGRGKLAGERAVAELLPETGAVVRTAWLYGEHGRNFVATMLRLAADRETLEVVEDQTGQPTWSRELARRLVELAAGLHTGTAPPGIYHGTAGGRTTWYGLARTVFALADLDPERIRPTTADHFASNASRRPAPAPRPAFSVLGHDRWADAGLPPMPDWRDSLAEALRRPPFAALAEEARRAAPRGRTTAGRA
jgi:dTDP-4-dehydrorhamnose reductase